MNIATSEVAELLGPHREKLPFHQRAYGPRWLTSELVAGDGRPKLRAWLRDAPPPPWESLDTRAILLQLQAFGDFDPALRLVADVLERIPRCVAEYCVDSVTFLGVGRSTLGWCGGVPDLDGRPWLVVIAGHRSDSEIRATVAHEIAHSWTLPPKEGLRSALWSSALRFNSDPSFRRSHADCVEAFEKGNVGVVAVYEPENADRPRRERLAERLARSWGYTNP